SLRETSFSADESCETRAGLRRCSNPRPLGSSRFRIFRLFRGLIRQERRLKPELQLGTFPHESRLSSTVAGGVSYFCDGPFLCRSPATRCLEIPWSFSCAGWPCRECC